MANHPKPKTHGPPPVAEAKLIPIIDRTEQDVGMGFVVGVGGNEADQQAEPKRAPSTTSPGTSPKSSGKRKGK